MVEGLLSFNWLSLMLSIFTFFLVAYDRAFSKKVRNEFQIALGLCLFLTLFTHHLRHETIMDKADISSLLLIADGIFRPVVLFMLVVATKAFDRFADALMGLPALVNIYFAFTGNKSGSDMVFCLYMALLVVSILVLSNKGSRKGDKFDYFFAVILFVIILSSLASEIILKNESVTNDSLCFLTCVYYYYLVMRTYKKDGLTGLLIRHNLNYEMQDLINKTYDIVLIDVDNFKLINDKYGHDKGDEVLVTIVNTVQDNLIRGCRMYRFGGDEFVIISRKVSQEELRENLESINNQLANDDLRISYGIVRHNSGEDSAESLMAADKAMYENKRLLKSEDIWDDMTGLYNYRGFLDELEAFRKNVAKEKKIVTLVAADIEHLNNINMAYGYTEGNMVIKTLSRVIKTCLRGQDFIGHLGSDEFVVAIACDTVEDKYVTNFMIQLQESMDSAYELLNKDYTVKLNIARYVIEEDNDLTCEDCVNNVLYIKQEDKENRRKSDGSDNGQDYNKQEETIVLDIIENNKLRYAFQPIVSAKDGSIVAYETLMRSDTETMISPLKILKYAERNKKSYEVEKHTFFNVFDQISKMSSFTEDRRIFINSIPGYFLTETDYEILKNKYGHLFSRMVVEITEQREIDDDALAALNARRDKDGFNLAIDDYGSGCSNTNSLLRYMPQVVKLDRLLITGIDRNAKKQFFVNSIITFARENDMMILAEGVETESELKTVIRLGVDLIQGYITAKPSHDMLGAIPDNIVKIIIDENLKVGSNQRKVYMASGNCELSVVNLAMEDYSKINVSAEYVTINGSTEYTADMVIRIKDGVSSHVTLSNVKLNSLDDEPCIDVGEGAHLTLNLEGNNSLNARGIHVPEGSSLTVIGAGNIAINVKGHQCYAIGADTESGFGKLLFKNSGTMDINVDGEQCVGIGGGVTGENSEIGICAGHFEMNVAGVNAVAVGCYKGDVPISITDTEFISVFRVNMGTVIGSLEGTQNIKIKNFNIDIKGSGTEISGIGSIKETTGNIEMVSGSYQIKLNGHKIILFGCDKGNLKSNVSHTRLEMTGEGDCVLGFGSFDMRAYLGINECSMGLVINAAEPLAFGAADNNIVFKGPIANVNVNGNHININQAGN